ncbi:MAG: hypothetical protein L3J45_04605 [Flavobacteriaceae bacterium]|nr:hypothetical protein [Flavobacteriaceae bacterium]
MKTKLLFGLFLIATLQFTNAQAGHTIGLVGAFNGWGSTPDAMLTTTDDINYTLTGWVLAADSEIKFRQDQNWTGTAWGSTNASDWPSGTGSTTPGGPNIFAVAGTYDVSFNITTGVYMFSTQTISLIGAFNGWAGDVDLTSTDNVNYTLTGWTLAANGELKFRQDHAWTTSWGAPSGTGWPSATGSTAGFGNILAIAGTWDVAFNFSTLAYSFTAATLAVGDFTKTIQFYYVNNALNINGYNGQASIKAFDVMGRLLYNKENIQVQNGFSQNIKLPKNQVSFILVKGEKFTKSLKVIALQ